MKRVSLPPAFYEVFKSYITPLLNGPAMQRCVEITEHPEARVADFNEVLSDNPLYLHFLLKLPILDKKVATWVEEEQNSPRTNEVIAKRVLELLGKTASRNVLFAVNLRRKTPGGLPRGKKDTLNLNLQDDVKFAIHAEQVCNEENLAFGPEAFLAGLHFDWLKFSFAANKAPNDAVASIDETFKLGIESAKMAYHVAALVKEFKFNRMVFGCSLLTHVGTSLMYLLYPKELKEKSFAYFNSDIEKRLKSYRLEARGMLEPRNFEIHTTEISSLLVTSFGPFQAVEKAIQYAHDPVFLKGSNPDLFKLACILSISNFLTQLKGDQFNLPYYQKYCGSALKLNSAKLEKVWRETKLKSKKAG